MRYPNLRYGNPNELVYYAQGITVKDLAKRLRRSERTLRNWMTHREKMPWWAPEILRLQQMEHREMMRQMGIRPAAKQLGLVSGTVFQFKPRSKAVLRRGPVEDEKSQPELAKRYTR